jgi:hypothetical protein
VSALPVLSATPPVTAVSAPLLLRKPDAAARPSRAAPPAPAITTSATGVIARTAAAPHSTPNGHGSHADAAAPEKGAWAYGEYWNIDRIVEQVGLRLARRLEVERERTGVRQWRS